MAPTFAVGLEGRGADGPPFVFGVEVLLAVSVHVQAPLPLWIQRTAG